MKKLTGIKKVIDKNSKHIMTSIYMEFDDNTVENLFSPTIGVVSNVGLSEKLEIIKLYMKRIIDGSFEIDDLAWLNILFNQVSGDKDEERELNNLWHAINFLILTKNKNVIHLVSSKLEEMNDEDVKVKEYAL